MSEPKIKLTLISNEKQELIKRQEHLQKRKEYYQANKEKLQEAQREYYRSKHPDSDKKVKKTENKQEYFRQYRLKIKEDALAYRALQEKGLVPEIN